MSCFYTVSHVWYTVYIFLNTPATFSTQSIETESNWKYKCPSSVVQNIAESCVPGQPAIDSCFFPLSALSLYNSGGATSVKFTTSHCIGLSQPANTANLLFHQAFCHTAIAFLHFFFLWQKTNMHTHCTESPMAVRQERVLIRSA